MAKSSNEIPQVVRTVIEAVDPSRGPVEKLRRFVVKRRVEVVDAPAIDLHNRPPGKAANVRGGERRRGKGSALGN